MAYCGKCGKKLSDVAIFCPNCGSKVTKTHSTASTKENTPVAPAAPTAPVTNNEPATPAAPEAPNDTARREDAGMVPPPVDGDVATQDNAVQKAAPEAPNDTARREDARMVPPPVDDATTAAATNEIPSADDSTANKTAADDATANEKESLGILPFVLGGLVVLVIILGIILYSVFGVGGPFSSKVDISKYYSLEVAGPTTQARANAVADRAGFADDMQNKVPEGEDASWVFDLVEVTLDKSEGLENGDIVTMTFDYSADEIKDTYGINVVGTSKKVKIDGLSEPSEEDQLSSAISEESLAAAESAVRALTEHDVANQNTLIPGGALKDFSYVGYYLLTSPDGSRLFVPVYRTVATYPYGNEMSVSAIDASQAQDKEITYYSGIVISNITDADGKLSFGAGDMSTDLFHDPEAIIIRDGGYNYEDTGRLYYGFKGFEARESFENALKKTYPDYEIEGNF